MQKRHKSLLLTIFLLIIGVLLFATTTTALFRDASIQINHTFQSGSVDVQMEYASGNQTLAICNLAPGNSGSEHLIISNVGTMTAEYSIEINKSGTLAEGETPLETKLQDTSGITLPTDAKHILAPGQEETLTLIWYLPIEAGNAYMGAEAQLCVRVHASQHVEMSVAN